MNGYPTASATTTCSTLSHRATTSAVEIEKLLKKRADQDPALKELAILATKLRQFRQHADHLGECLRRASVLSPSLQEAVSGQVLPTCDRALAMVSKELMRLTPETSSRDINANTLRQYGEMLNASAKFFLFAMQLSQMTTPEEQEVKLETQDAKEMIKHALATARSPNGIFLGSDGRLFIISDRGRNELDTGYVDNGPSI